MLELLNNVETAEPKTKPSTKPTTKPGTTPKVDPWNPPKPSVSPRPKA